jgi:hypothetical protein
MGRVPFPALVGVRASVTKVVRWQRQLRTDLANDPRNGICLLRPLAAASATGATAVCLRWC